MRIDPLPGRVVEGKLRFMRYFACLLLLFGYAIHTSAQTHTTTTSAFLDHDTYFASSFGGAGVSSDGTARSAAVQMGGAAGTETLSDDVGGLGIGQFLEVGAMGPFTGRDAPAAFLSYDLSTTIRVGRDPHLVPFAAAGYSYMFGEASAVNFGLGVDFHYRRYRAIRVEVRDYFTFTATPQHNVALRLGWQFSVNNP